jgi:hypothetical protein
MDLEMEIIGDPYYIVQSGQGNYTASATQYSNLNDDGSMNYQNGEVDIIVNFRTPIDINQTSGLYNFKGSASSPVTQWSGMYSVTDVISTFRDGQFKQTLKGFRRTLQELQEEVGQLRKFINDLNSNLGTIVKTSFAKNFSFISQDNTLTGM